MRLSNPAQQFEQTLPRWPRRLTQQTAILTWQTGALDKVRQTLLLAPY